jgi:hypothetical protein
VSTGCNDSSGSILPDDSPLQNTLLTIFRKYLDSLALRGIGFGDFLKQWDEFMEHKGVGEVMEQTFWIVRDITAAIVDGDARRLRGWLDDI